MKIPKINISNKTLGWLAPLFLIGAICVMSSNKTPMWMDEYIFYRLSSEFPNYSTSATWITQDRPALLNASINWEDTSMEVSEQQALADTYNNAIYTHTPLMPMLMSPIVKGLNSLADNGVIPHIEDEVGLSVADPNNLDNYANTNPAETMTIILRIIPIVLILVSLALIFKLLYRKVGNRAYFFAIPVAAVVRLLTGAYFFYWDVFMIFFFVLTLYLMETKPNQKWAYWLTACMMVNTKMWIGLLFLIPLMVKDKKIILAGFSLIPFWIVTWRVTGDFFYLWNHYANGVYIHNFVYSLYEPLDMLTLMYSLGIPLLLLMTIPLFKFWKKYPEYIATFIVIMAYAWGAGLGMTQLSNQLYAGALVFPIVVYEFHLAEKLKRWISPKKLEVRV